MIIIVKSEKITFNENDYYDSQTPYHFGLQPRLRLQSLRSPGRAVDIVRMRTLHA